MEERAEIIMRIKGIADDQTFGAVRRVVTGIDPAATLKVDPETGFLHVETSAQALDITAALAKAGHDATAMTG